MTEAGKIVALRARRVLNDMNSIRLAIDRFKGLEDVELTVGASNIPGNYMIPEIVPVLRRQFPGLMITVLYGDSRDIGNKIAAGEVEIGIVGSRFDGKALSFAPLERDRIVLVVGPTHPWFDKPSVDHEELRQQVFICRERGSGTGKTVDEALTAIGIDPAELDTRIVLGSNEGIKHAVAAGAGISFISELSVRNEVERGELRTIAIHGLEISRHFYLASRAGRELSPAAAAFAGISRELYGKGIDVT